MKHSRRKFIQYSGLASASLLVPEFLKAFQRSGSISSGNKILVVIQLGGGNDGLNTVVPFQNDIYYKSRPTIAVSKEKVLKLNDELGLNDSLEAMKGFYDDGFLSIINNVGYPNPDRSHFRSMDIWQTGSGSEKVLSTGWLGRYLDSQCAGCENAHHAIEIDDALSLAMKGESRNGIALERPEALLAAINSPFFKKITAASVSPSASDNLSYLYKTAVQTQATAQYVYDYSKAYKSNEEYPNSEFGSHLKTIAELIISGIDTRVFYVSQTGYDTHANQVNQQGRMLQQLNDGLKAMVSDFKKNNRMNDVLIFTFSEFGRRVEQNGSGGTDHGTANNVFLINGSLNHPGIYNDTPDLADLDQGDLKHHIDFRQLYATVINKWLDADDEKILGRKFDLLNIV